MANRRFDVAIIGGGPAGSAAAIALARDGISVVLIEKTRYDHTRIGETLLPAARALLAKLGVWEKFLGDKHAPSPANLSAWGECDLVENHFIFNPYGNGWHIDRARFDAMLACTAEDAGARIWRGSRVNDWGFEQNAWRVVVEGAAEITARFLIDATGRAGVLSRQTGAKRAEADRLVGLIAFFENGSYDDNRTLVESAENGWWYSASLLDERRVIAYMTDADLLPSSQAAVAEYWRARLMQTAYTIECSDVQKFEHSVNRFSAQTFISNPIFGENWLAVGDAAFAFDPLSSQGIYKALETGMHAADSIAKYFDGETHAFDGYADWAQSRYQKFLLKRNWYYNQERRWIDSEFWKRRQRDEVNDR